jgi:S1-C subfamily serine protease
VADTLASRRAQFQDRLGAELSQRRYLFPSVIEHDSVLEPRQCGGVLLNLRGEAIGVNIARASRISSYAIPAEVAVPIVRSLQAADQHARATTVASQTPGGSLEQEPPGAL